MNRRKLIPLLSIAAAVALIGAGAGSAGAAAQLKKPATVPIVMHDPGCHWFFVGGAYKTRLTVSGPTTFRNLDEATLIVKGKGFDRLIPVGRQLTVAQPGTYHITMVRQAPDDNHLLLVVR